MALSPTQRSLAMLRKEGCELVAVVERWNPHARIRQDLFGIIDILAIKDHDTIAVQCTSGTHVADRIKKMEASDALPALREAGWTIHVHGWRKVKVKRGGKAMKWECRVVDIS